MRDCPTVEGSSIPLIIHRIAVSDCLSRQSCNYHKCHRCVYRGQAANWSLPEPGVAPMTERTSQRGVPTRIVEVPRPEPLLIDAQPVAASPTKKTGKARPAGKGKAKPIAPA